jgi:mRNA interferase RelE/StbE
VSYRVLFAATARRDLRSIPPRIVAAIVEFAFGDLAADPRRVGKPLRRDLVGTFSARRGAYRVLYTVDDDEGTVQILRIDHRADVYRPR